MPSYRLRQDFFPLKASFAIADGDGNDRFQVDGQSLSTGATFTDLKSGDVLELVQGAGAFFVKWNILRDGVTVARMERQRFLSPSFHVDVEGPNDFAIRQSGMIRLHASVSRTHDGDVAKLYHPELLSGDLIIDIEPGQDDALIVAFAAILVMLRRQG